VTPPDLVEATAQKFPLPPEICDGATRSPTAFPSIFCA
jgi:hypothetical protein